MWNKRKKRIRKIQNSNSIKRKNNTKRRNSISSTRRKEYLWKKEIDEYFKISKKNNSKKKLYYWKLYKKMWLTIKIDLDKISEHFKKILFITKDDIYEYENKQRIINSILKNNNFLNSQNYIIWNTEKKKVFSISYTRELVFKISENFFNIKLFFTIISLFIFTVSQNLIYLLFFILIYAITLYPKENSKYNILGSHQNQNNFIYLKNIFMYWIIYIWLIILLFNLLWIILSIFPDNIILSYKNILNHIFEKSFFPLIWIFTTIIFTRILFKLNIFHIIFSPLFILLKILYNLDYFINYKIYNKKIYKLKVKKLWYVLKRDNFLKKDKYWNFINDSYLIKN